MRDRQLTVLPDPDALAREAATRMLARLVRCRDRCAVCLTGGATPERLYRLLATEPYRGALPWGRIHWFWGDERFVPHHDPRSNAGAARRALLDRVPVPPGNIHAVPTQAASEREAANLYETELRRFYGVGHLDPQRPLFDVVLLGMGPDGHTASLFPGRPALEETERWVLGIAEAGFKPFVPRVTLTLPALASTQDMLFLVVGPEKRDALGRVLSGADLPAARAYSQGDLVWLVDHNAAPELGNVT